MQPNEIIDSVDRAIGGGGHPLQSGYAGVYADLFLQAYNAGAPTGDQLRDALAARGVDNATNDAISSAWTNWWALLNFALPAQRLRWP